MKKSMAFFDRKTCSLSRAVIALLMASCASVASAQNPDGPPPATVEVETAIADDVAATSWVPGTVVSLNDARIAADVAGRVVWIADVGDYIASGSPVARIEDREIQLALADNEATVARLEAQLSYQQSQLDRLTRLSKDNNAAATQLDEARSQLAVLTQDLRAAEVDRERWQYRLGRTQVTAPFSGQVVERLIQVGEYVNTGAPVARVVDTTAREVRARAPIATARFVRSGQRVRVEDDFQSSDTDVRAVVPVGDERSRMIELRVTLDDATWMIGSAVRVALPTSEVRSLVAIPRDALVLRGSDSFVFRIGEDSMAEKISVRTGVGLGEWVEVLQGIAPGDRLVVRGNERLSEGQAVTILDPTASG